MDDSDVLALVKAAAPEVHMHRPVEAIVARGQTQRQHRRRLAGLGISAGLLALAVAVVLVPTLQSASGRATITAPLDANVEPTAVHVHLAAFSLDSEPGGTATLILIKGQAIAPDVLSRDLTRAGIPAVVEIGRFCDSPGIPTGLDQVITQRRRPDGTVTVTFNPAAMPNNSALSIGIFPLGKAFALVEAGVPLSCKSAPDTPFH
jgi:hypothetical protein